MEEKVGARVSNDSSLLEVRAHDDVPFGVASLCPLFVCVCICMCVYVCVSVSTGTFTNRSAALIAVLDISK